MSNQYTTGSFRNLWKCFAPISIAAIVFALVLEGMLPVDGVIANDEQAIAMIGVSIIALPLVVAQIVLFFMLLYRLWNIIPANEARTTPGAAVGLWFIPLFTYYWGYVAFVGLAKDLKNLLQSRQLPTDKISEPLAVAWYLSMLAGSVPPMAAAMLMMNPAGEGFVWELLLKLSIFSETIIADLLYWVSPVLEIFLMKQLTDAAAMFLETSDQHPVTPVQNQPPPISPAPSPIPQTPSPTTPTPQPQPNPAPPSSRPQESTRITKPPPLLQGATNKCGLHNARVRDAGGIATQEQRNVLG